MNNNKARYRGFSERYRKWFLGFLFQDINLQNECLSYILKATFVPVRSMPSSKFIEVENNSVGELTDISDANDINIYTGDLFEVVLLEFGVKNPIKIIGEVVSFRGCYMIKYNYQKEERYSDLYDFVVGNEKYIVGNTTENSDLLS